MSKPKTTQLAPLKAGALTINPPQRVVTQALDIWRRAILPTDVVNAAGELSTAPPALPLTEEDAVLLVPLVRQLLAKPATEGEICKALAVMTATVPWSDRIDDRASYLTLLCEGLRRSNFASEVIAEAVWRAASTSKYTPSLADLVEQCRAVQAEVEAGLMVVEASAHERFLISYNINFMGLTQREVMTLLKAWLRSGAARPDGPINDDPCLAPINDDESQRKQ